MVCNLYWRYTQVNFCKSPYEFIRQRTRVAFDLRGDQAINASQISYIYPPARIETNTCACTISGPLPEHQSIQNVGILSNTCAENTSPSNTHAHTASTTKPWAGLESPTGYVLHSPQRCFGQ